MGTERIIRKTQSLCPVCLKKLDAEIYPQGENTYLEKSCALHGTFRTIVWKGSIPMEKWIIKKQRAHIN